MSELLKSFSKPMPTRQGELDLTTPATTSAPVAVPLTPQEKLKTLMDARSWSLLQSLLGWAVVWDKVHRGEVVPYNSDTQAVMLAPFTFFGQDAPSWGNVATYIQPTLMYQIESYRNDALYAKANPMPWLVLQYVAPQLCQFCHGPAAMGPAMDTIRLIRETNELPIG